ncbi:hypothetical protein HC752_13865 [Vibrio sp. S9_S30]|uniref:hypothetical protein n=1 Tax=Vibrio sp. S9_S30 TaxID=2720226 RepID=UPI0016805180|nr:hypothetical protein [Vibrio sp. S9_S30]MBD1558022.1 hypothetical protein [Vibrio sp. S9_S30]
MMIANRKHGLLYLSGIIILAYFFWSLLTINQLTKQVTTEKARVANVARSLELWKQITISSDGYLNQSVLLKENQDIQITPVEDTDIEDGQRFYVMYYSETAKEQDFRQYFSDLVLGNYFYILTDSDGKIREFFWDKP